MICILDVYCWGCSLLMLVAYALSETSLLVQLGAGAAALSAIIGLVYLLAKAIRSVQSITIKAISAAVDLSNTGHLVDYHLGPTDGTTPLYQRVQAEATQVDECHTAIAGVVERVERIEVQLGVHRQTEVSD